MGQQGTGQSVEDAPVRPFDVTHKSVLSIAVPMTLGFLTAPLIGLTDTGVVGRLGDPAALAGLAIGAILFDLIFGSLSFFRTSTTGLTAQAFGRGDAREEQAVFWRAFISAIGLGLLMLMATPLILAYAPGLMTDDAAVADVTRHYFGIRVLSSPATFINFAILGYVLGRGQGTLGLLLQVIINGSNVILSIYLGLHLGWGVDGVAWGTACAEVIGAVAGLTVIFRQFAKMPGHRPSRTDVFDRDRLKALFHLNADILVRSLVLNIAFALMTRVGSSFGAVTLAANAVLMNIFMLCSFFLDGLAGAAEQLAGRSIGARYRPAFDRALKLTALWSLAMGCLLALFFFAFGSSLIDILTTSPAVRAEAMSHLAWAALTGVTGALAFQLDGVFIGATWSRAMRNMMLASLAGFCVAVAILVPAYGNHGLWLALNLFMGMRGLFLAAMLPSKARQSFAAAQ
ncbi:MATE family efflux transporter [Rhizobiales bacterium RZME27]|uniref:MATE family efflux transporter n=1 Tax=Endobacterium cereale TaxID=2663029 RepID=A0A6A8A3J5_9HYPH|nr:MATE family efflux transporter [Endobacterium cereale]MEB2844694.1 MATE family efflux transporter [Endobacterium cereale]MQY45483.1 MATE family efflux transporter [Endobacterium cereale]